MPNDWEKREYRTVRISGLPVRTKFTDEEIAGFLSGPKPYDEIDNEGDCDCGFIQELDGIDTKYCVLKLGAVEMNALEDNICDPDKCSTWQMKLDTKRTLMAILEVQLANKIFHEMLVKDFVDQIAGMKQMLRTLYDNYAIESDKDAQIQD